ncbi:uncharacterized membrane protein YgdD (TMEM256/DUF423 family) [Amycolatopsis thermophila]|uniref:Uncharacterized membrane protein YgdD (TMEM256/DUF423 family) n=1 Tax=Amycolatopsis thermophila TaxID=206084 RepID=A0ABU0EQ00_9PSEU|nr:uncharacterized membrane protein YgdD (TMEM256/DUF423 family) [Amycolatopsis thermophila]
MIVLSGPTQLFTVIALVSLPTVMFGGYSLLGLLRKRKLTEEQRAFFRAGHAHAGVLLVLALVTLQLVAAGGLGTAGRWAVSVLLLVGILAQSGGLFLNLLPGRKSLAHGVTVSGAVLLAGAMITTAVGVAVA